MQELAVSALREVELRMAGTERSRVVSALITHLRDPLTIVQLNVDLLEDNATEAEQAERIQRIREACDRMEVGFRQCLQADRQELVSATD